MVAVLTIITFGIYGLYWQYAKLVEMNDYSGQGIGGVVGLLLAIFISIVNIFLLPAEIGNLYFREAKARPVKRGNGILDLPPDRGMVRLGGEVPKKTQ